MVAFTTSTRGFNENGVWDSEIGENPRVLWPSKIYQIRLSVLDENTIRAMIGEEEAHEQLVGRFIPGSENSEAQMNAHRRVVGDCTRTRFPPEPNGYLHIGHAKSMNMNFSLAFDKLGVPMEQRQTMFRYDDTNPEAESKEYIDALRADVEWLGWSPLKTTYSSDYFDDLYEMAVKLIKIGKAFVCHQKKEDIDASRMICRAKLADPSAPGDPNSPWRDRSVEENLKEFEKMRSGLYAASEATLRMKIDMSHPNPNMWDFVAYRIRYIAHPHAGDKWCIYPTYDYTHCIVDSLEDIDYSICTLEFENRRESYYWLLEALNLYRPKVYEMSRLNITNTVLSKRKLLKLVNTGLLRGWDDPRMPTIRGLRRRGYTKEILNTFCTEIGVTRNENLIQYDRIAFNARLVLHDISVRLMAVLDPLKIVLTCDDSVDCKVRPGPNTTVTVPDFPHVPARGSHEVPFTTELFIDQSDFRLEDDKDFFGLAPGKVVGLKYGCHIRCDSVELDADKKPKALKCTVVNDPAEAAKGMLQWVSANSTVKAEVRMYDHLFTVEEPDDNWEAQLNQKSEVVYKGALVDISMLNYKGIKEWHCQFERIGFFVVDSDTTDDNLVFNLTVALKDSKPAVTKGKSRKEEQARQLAEKLARMSIAPEDLFKDKTDLYSQFDADGVPTHDAAGEKLSKSAGKKLKKEWDKHKTLYESNKN